jgi:hypothetical protein
LAALNADRAETTGEGAIQQEQLERAALLEPGRWEFARRTAELHYKNGAPAKARTALARYLAMPGKPAEREAAFEMWDRANILQ